MTLGSGFRNGYTAQCWAWFPELSTDSKIPTQARDTHVSMQTQSLQHPLTEKAQKHPFGKRIQELSQMFPTPLGPEKQAQEFPKFRLNCISGAFQVCMSQKYGKAIFGEGWMLLFVFVANAGPAKLWGYRKEQGKLSAVGGSFNMCFLTWRKFTYKF